MHTFKKEERLSRKKIIESLFLKGNSFSQYPVKVVWLDYPLEGKYPAQVLISVPKRKFKRAVDRNLLKRRIREAYRKNKESLYDYLRERDKTCVLALLYISNDIVSYNEIEEKIILALERCKSEYEKTAG
jgi:ribonuclease P protein component